MSQKEFSGFPRTSREEWVAKATKDLRGKPFEDLISHTSDGIQIQPFYTEEQRTSSSFQPTKRQNDWVIIQEVLVKNNVDANAQALKLLGKGVSGLLFYLATKVDLKVLLKDVQIEHLSVHFVVDGDGALVLEQLKEIVDERGLDLDSIRGSINVDGIENALRTGNWFTSEASDLESVKSLGAHSFPNFRTSCVNANIYGNAGATPAQQLGLALAHAHEYLLQGNPNAIWFNFSIGSTYFEEVAKFRAARRLWSLLLEEYELPQEEMHIYAENGMRNKTIYDPWVNMLRTTTEGMSAVLGGVNELNLKPYNVAFDSAEDFGERVARNQQLLLQFESYLDKVDDPSAGAYFVENLTDDLAKLGWDFFKEIEEQGGLIAAMKNGWIQEQVETAAQKEQSLFDDGKLNLLGTNLYPNKEEVMKEKAKHPVYFKGAGQNVVQPLKTVRLSEKLEVERLAAEQ